MRAFLFGVFAVILIAGAAALVSGALDRSSASYYQAHDGSVRLSRP